MVTTTGRPRSPSTPTRRALLAGAAAALALALPAVATCGTSADAPDPHPAWLAEWQATRAALFAPDGDDVEDDDPDWLRLLELEDLIAETPAHTLAGARAQLALLHHTLSDVRSFHDGDVRGLENAIATLERLAGEARHG